jgi:hypothetical protein
MNISADTSGFFHLLTVENLTLNDLWFDSISGAGSTDEVMKCYISTLISALIILKNIHSRSGMKVGVFGLIGEENCR